MRLPGTFDRDIRDKLGEPGVIKRTDALDARALLGRPFIRAAKALVATARSIIEQGLA